MFGRVAVLDMSRSLVVHAHSQAHILVKIGGVDSHFLVRDRVSPLTDCTAVLVNTWEPHSYVHPVSDRRTLVLAVYIEPLWHAARVFGCATRSHFSSTTVAIDASTLQLVRELSTRLIFDTAADFDFMEQGVGELLRAVEEVAGNDLVAGDAEGSAEQCVDRRIARCVEYMRANLGEREDLGVIAGRFGLSRPHLFYLFQRTFHVTPGIYWNTLRMEYALQHLTSGTESIGAIGQNLGFGAQSNFTRFFQSIQGVGPKDYQLATIASRRGDRAGGVLAA
jgi:AraC-like DNA-binding protein